MQPLNPFLRAFFRSGLPSQCVPAQNHILLVPTTEFLLTSWDRDSNARYSDLVGSDEFLGSHVLRIPANATAEAAVAAVAKGAGTTRDGRGKAKQLSTVNGRTVIVKEAFVYSNKGFKNLAQAQLLNDVLWYPDQLDAQQWLIYFISRPLIGVAESYSTTLEAFDDASHLHAVHALQQPARSSSELTEPKKDIRTFNELLNSFPMIARQMEPGLQRLFKEFAKAFEKPPPSRPSQPDADQDLQAAGSALSAAADASVGSGGAPTTQRSPPPVVTEEDEQASLRQGMESLVTGAIELFQLVDKQQLSLLGTSTTVTGPAVEKLIERYMLEQVHHSVLFPRICALNRPEDQDLEAKVRRMENIDVSQVGILIPGGMEGKHEVLLRLDRGVEEFRKLGVAGSPHEMVEVLLATEKSLAAAPLGGGAGSKKDDDCGGGGGGGSGALDESEKPFSGLAMNADTLVSLLLVVVIRAQVRHLRAQLAYMHDFIFIDDVEAGETGYALSTLEAVLSYLSRASGGLRAASRKNKRLWEAARHGRVREIKSILAPSEDDGEDEDDSEDPEPGQGHYGASSSNPNGSVLANGAVKETSGPGFTSTGSTLGHVFPFYSVDQASTTQATRSSKRVSVDTRSMSSSSGRSFHSRTVTLDSRTSGIEGDTSVERLAQTQDQSGNSILMIAVENRQPEALRFLLGLQQFYPLDVVLRDCNNDRTTLLSAAVQTGEAHTIDALLDFVMRAAADDGAFAAYFARQDVRGRTMAHYLFNAHRLVKRIGSPLLLPWRAKDRNGQTPLFALCRSYDHASYHEMVYSALVAAEEAQGDGLPLHLDDHVDGKGNTLLHIVNDPQLVRHLLQECDSDVNATNGKRFTPLMVASKYGRIDLVNVLLGDPRVDLYAKELRGLTAIELAKDDDVRNRIDDLILLSMPADADGRIVAVVRSYFVEDATVRLVVKSAVPSTKAMVTITTSRRSLSDFENLARCLSTEHPASWLPSVSGTVSGSGSGSGLGFRSPFQIPSRPSRAVLRDIQLRLDNFLRILLAHSTFATHEMLWEFFLVPEMLPDMMVDRSKAKAAVRAETVRDDYSPVAVADVHDVDLFAQHAKNEVRRVKEANAAVVRSANKIRSAGADLADALRLCAQSFGSLGVGLGLGVGVSVVDGAHAAAVAQAAATWQPSDSAPHVLFQQDMRCISTTIAAMQTSLSQPRTTIEAMTRASATMERHLSTLRRSDRWTSAVPLGLNLGRGLLDNARSKLQHDASRKVDVAAAQLASLGAELRYAQQTVAAELAAWHDLHAKIVARALRSLALRSLVAEKARLDALRRAVRKVGGLHGGG